MANETKNPRINSVVSAFSLCVVCALSLISVFAQEEAKKVNAAEAIKKVKQGNFLAVDVEEIAKAHAVEAIPALGEQFARTVDPSHLNYLDPGNKAKIASALVRLGDKDPIYWDFLEKQATLALDSDAPYPGSFDSRGKAVPRELSPEFVEWAKSQHIAPESLAETAMYKLPGRLLLLAETGDPRGLPLLRRAMSSRNYMIQAVAAKGLAKLLDKDSIPLIIEACQRAPMDAAPGIAEALVYFDDPQAQMAAEKFLPKDFLQAIRNEYGVLLHDPFSQ
jgi:HEAT repeat protein